MKVKILIAILLLLAFVTQIQTHKVKMTAFRSTNTKPPKNQPKSPINTSEKRLQITLLMLLKTPLIWPDGKVESATCRKIQNREEQELTDRKIKLLRKNGRML